MAEYYMMFKNLNLNQTNIEDLLQQATVIMEIIPVEFVINDVKEELQYNSPVVKIEYNMKGMYLENIKDGIAHYNPFDDGSSTSSIIDI